MHWEKELAYPITPKSGPMRRMETLLDANRSLTQDLPRGYLRRPNWLKVGQKLVDAAETGSGPIIREATEILVAAIEAEGWMTRQPKPQSLNDPTYWQLRAREARHLAARLEDPKAKTETLKIADEYDHLALRAVEVKAVRGD